MKNKNLLIALFLTFGISLSAQDKVDINELEITAYWCKTKVEGKSVWKKKNGLTFENKPSITKNEILNIQYQLINKGFDLSPSGIIDENTMTAITEYQEYNSKENIRKRKKERKKEKK